MRDDARFAFYDLAPGEESFRDAVLHGLARPRKAVPCKFFYDERGSALFEEICRLPEYYPTRTEIAILDENADEIAAQMGAYCRLIEFGSGASRKVRILLQALDRPAAYVPVDISREHLREAAATLAEDFPELAVVAVCADYTGPFTLPQLPGPAGKRVGFFPGSTIGNFEPDAAARFLANCANILGAGGEMLIGVDLKKDARILDAAYNDRAGRHRRVQSQSVRAHQSRTRRRSRSRPVRAFRLLQRNQRAGRNLHPQPRRPAGDDRRPPFQLSPPAS